LPLYSLAKLLFPVITHQDRLRDDLVLVKVVLRPLSKPVRASWKETCQRCLEILQRCVYLDKDLVLPPITASGAEETYLVVASTDLDSANTMMARIREQLEKVAGLNGAGNLEVSALAVPVPDRGPDQSLEAQVKEVARVVSEMVATVPRGKQDSPKHKPDQN
jgi:hypothetical protein